MSERPVYTDNFVYVGLSLNLAETDWKSPVAMVDKLVGIFLIKEWLIFRQSVKSKRYIQ